jgi:hypothetical protein
MELNTEPLVTNVFIRVPEHTSSWCVSLLMTASLTIAPCKVNRDPRIYGMSLFEKIPKRNLDENFCNPFTLLFNKYAIWALIP